MTQAARGQADNFWQASEHTARLCLAGLGGTLELAAPQQGLRNLSVYERELAGQVLGVQYERIGAEALAPPSEHYERGTDLVAVYDQVDLRPFRAVIYWRALSRDLPASGVGLDLIVSVQTSLLDATPELSTVSRFSEADAVVFPMAGDSPAKPQLDLSRAAPLRGSAARPGCVVVRLEDSGVTYCEMIHPSDCRGLEATHSGDDAQWGWPLVGHFMEKGVIRRLRLRGVFLAGHIEDCLVDELYTDFAASPPPLTA